MTVANGNKTLITGAGGYLGARLAERVLESGTDGVVLWVHAQGADDARAKIDSLAPRFARFGERAEWAWGELGTGGAPFANVPRAGVTRIVHSAAVTRFNVDEDTAQRVNVDGADALLAFATTCPRLERVTLLSTVYASGLRAGVIPEEALDDDHGFANHYEASKWRAERLARTKYAGLPVSIARVATVIADDETGAVTQKNAVHNTLKLLFHGLMSLVPGHADTPLYFVTGDFVVDAIMGVLERGRAGGVYHVVHRREESISLGELVKIAFEVFRADPKFAARRILEPEWVDAESFDVLVDGIQGFGGEALKQALMSVAPFARQLFVGKDMQNGAMTRTLDRYRAPRADALVRNTVESLVATKWGRAA